MSGRPLAFRRKSSTTDPPTHLRHLMALPSSSTKARRAHTGTTPLPQARSRSTRSATPGATRRMLGSVTHHRGASTPSTQGHPSQGPPQLEQESPSPLGVPNSTPRSVPECRPCDLGCTESATAPLDPPGPPRTASSGRPASRAAWGSGWPSPCPRPMLEASASGTPPSVGSPRRLGSRPALRSRPSVSASATGSWTPSRRG